MALLPKFEFTTAEDLCTILRYCPSGPNKYLNEIRFVDIQLIAAANETKCKLLTIIWLTAIGIKCEN